MFQLLISTFQTNYYTIDSYQLHEISIEQTQKVISLKHMQKENQRKIGCHEKFASNKILRNLKQWKQKTLWQADIDNGVQDTST